MKHKIVSWLATAALLSASGATAQTVVPRQAYANAPTGEGEPLAITCRPPQILPGSRLLGPEVCRTNVVWAQYNKDGLTVTADGLRTAPSEKRRSISMQNCRAPNFAAGGTIHAMSANVGIVCD